MSEDITTYQEWTPPTDVVGLMTARILARIQEAVEAERSPTSGFMIIEDNEHLRGRKAAFAQAIYQQLHKDIIEAAEEAVKAQEAKERIMKEAEAKLSSITGQDATGAVQRLMDERIPIRQLSQSAAMAMAKNTNRTPKGTTRCTNRTKKKTRR